MTYTRDSLYNRRDCDDQWVKQKTNFKIKHSHIPSSSEKCPLGFSLSSLAVTSSGRERAVEDDAEVVGDDEEEQWW